MRVTSCSLAMSSRARFQPTLPAPAMITYTRSRLRAERRLDDQLDRGMGGRDDVEAVGVPRGARRVEDTGDDLRDLEAPLGDLRNHEVGVVPVRRGDEHVRAVDARLQQRIDLERGAHGELAAAVLPRARVGVVEPLVGERVLVEDGDLAALVQRPLGHRRAHTTGADDEDERHGRADYPGVAVASPPPAAAAARALSCSRAGAVRITRHGAFESTYFVICPTASSAPPRPPSSAPPRVLVGGSAASTIASTPRRRAWSTMAWPVRRARTVAVATSTPSYSSPTALARARASRALRSWFSGRRASSGRAMGTSKTQSASITAPSASRSSRSSPARRPGVWSMSTSSPEPNTGTRIEPYSGSIASAGTRSAASGTVTRSKIGVAVRRREITYNR